MKIKFDKIMDVFKSAESASAGKESPAPPDKVIDKMAQDMPERESVWWACKSADKVDSQMTPEDIKAKLAAEAWVKEPTPDNKLAAGDAATESGHKGPGAWSAQAAAWAKDPQSETNVATSEDSAPEVAQSKELTSKDASAAVAVAGAVKLAAAMKSDPKAVLKALADSKQTPPEQEAEPAATPEKIALEQPKLEIPEKPEIQLEEVPEVLEKLQSPETPPPETAQQNPQPQPTSSEKRKTAKALKPFIELGKDVAKGKNTW